MFRSLLATDARSTLRVWLAVLAALARASLAAFIVQYDVYFTLLASWTPPFSPFWPLLFVASACVVLASGLLWGRHGHSDVFGIGSRRLAAAIPNGRLARASRQE
jgi:hypothetical protein